MAARNYSNVAVETTLVSGISNSATSMEVTDSTGYPAAPFTIVLEPGTADEEIILVGGKSGTTFSSCTRGYDSTSPAAHTALSVVKHVMVAQDAREMFDHDHNPTNGYTAVTHANTSGKGPNDHHAKVHAHDGADGSGTVAHSDTTGKGEDDHHAKDHAARHAVGGGDAVTIVEAQVSDLDHAGPIATHTTIAAAHHAKYLDAEAVAAILAADGTGSGLDADKLDGQEGAHYAPDADLTTLETTVAAHVGAGGAAHANVGAAAGFMTAALKTKLDAIEAAATADQSAADIRTLGFFDTSNDGDGSGLDADKLDGEHLSRVAPTGMIVMWPTDSSPSGWIFCRGQSVNRTTYADLFAVIGTVYGAGNGSTTFNVPDLQQRFPLGKAAAGTGDTLAGTGGEIDHDHSFYDEFITGGPNPLSGVEPGSLGSQPSIIHTHSGYVSGTTSTKNPPYLVLNYIIKV